MKKVFISALITIFFLGKTSKEVDEKTKRASWFRTFVYFTLTVLFGIFFYRSFQVATITNSIEINTLRCAVDSLNHPKDTIKELIIVNNFMPLGSYKNPMFDELKRDSNYSVNGGVEIKFQLSDFSIDDIKNRIGLSDSVKTKIESITGKEIGTETGSIYHLRFTSTSLPKFIPLYPLERYDIPVVKNEKNISTIEYKGNLRCSGDGKVLFVYPSEGYTAEGLLYQQTTVVHDQNIILGNMPMAHPLINTMDIFTACDLSQYTFNLAVKSDMYIKLLSVAYPVPIELGNQNDGMFVAANAFGINDADNLNKFVDGVPMTFLVKLPTMANLQQIRSLILTAMVTALFSLFCTNLFYRLRKQTVKYLIKKKINFNNEEVLIKYKVNDFKLLLHSFIVIILSFILIVVCLGILRYAILIDFENDFWTIAIKFIFVTIIILVLIYFGNDITTFLKKKEEKNNKRKKKSKKKS